MVPIPILTKKAHKIINLIAKMCQACVEQKRILQAKAEFHKLFTAPGGQYIVFAMICLAALLFDFFISSRTFGWLSDIVDIPVEVLALIFTLIDAGIAIMASGVLAHNLIEKDTLRRVWRPVLWGLGGIKILMFIIFVLIVYADVSEYSWVEVLLQTGFILLIYAVLGFAGEGLAYSCGSAWWTFVAHVWYDNPKSLTIKINNYLRDFDRKAQELGESPAVAREFYKLPSVELFPCQPEVCK